MSLLTVLFPEGRAAVLRLLFTNPAHELHLRDLARQSGMSLKTIQNELKKLSAADLVTSSRDGNRLNYRANASHPIYPDLQQLVMKTSGLREVLVEALHGLKGVDVAFVFGSLAGGDGTGSSDVDLMVIGNIGLRSLVPQLKQATEQLGREINPVSMTSLEFAKTRKSNPFLVDVMAKEKLFIKGTLRELE